jgi:plastocyanin
MRKIIALMMVVALAFVAVGCSSEKKVGTAIDVEKLAEKNKQLGKLDTGKKADAGGFVGEKEKEADDAAAAQEEATKNQAAQDEAVAKQKEEAAVAVSIAASGFDPYYIRVFTGGVVTVTNNFTKAASLTADRGEFDSGLLQPGDSWTYEPTTPGKFNFHDEGRPYVVGTLEVLAK